MSDLLIGLLILGGIVFVSWRWLFPIAIWMDRHPSWFRQWRLAGRPHEECPRCHKFVPIGYIAALREHHDNGPFGKNGLIPLDFDGKLDGGALGGGGFCGICGQFYSDYEERALWPDRFAPRLEEFL